MDPSTIKLFGNVQDPRSTENPVFERVEKLIVQEIPVVGGFLIESIVKENSVLAGIEFDTKFEIVIVSVLFNATQE